MKGKFDAYVLGLLVKRVQNLIVDRSTARNFTVVTIQLKAGLSEEKLSLMPSLRTFSKILFQIHCVLKENT